MAKHIVATVDEIAVGECKVVEIGGRSIGVFNVKGEFFAIRNSCPHQGGPLCAGNITGFLMASQPGEFSYTRRGEIVRCPWHGWEFDIKTGQSWFDPSKTRVRTYAVSVEAGEGQAAPAEGEESDGLQKGPYTAETFPVSVEKQYVLVEVPGR